MLTIPEQVKQICELLAPNGEIIERQNVLRLSKQRGINIKSVLLADYCDNTKTGDWSPHSFLHWVGRGKYKLK